jgi:hypothetical protein
MHRLILLLSLLFFAQPIVACSCDSEEISDQQFKNAKNIFLFRIRSIHVIEGKNVPIENGIAVGAIRVVENYKGTAHYSSFQYSTSYCCGSKFQVGEYYLAILDKDGKLLSASPENTIGMGRSLEQEKGLMGPNQIRRRILSAVDGLELFSKAFPVEHRMTTSSVPPPPPPPPPPCPPDKEQP